MSLNNLFVKCIGVVDILVQSYVIYKLKAVFDFAIRGMCGLREKEMEAKNLFRKSVIQRQITG